MPHNNTYVCQSNADCNFKGTCLTSTVPHECRCDFFWLTEKCEVPFDSVVYPGWQALIAGVAAIQGCVLLLSTANLIQRYRCRFSVKNSNLRDWSMILTAAGSGFRLMWLIDPVGLAGIFPHNFSTGVLLRLPQILWTAAMLLVILVWSSVIYAMESRPAAQKRLKWFVAVSIIVLALVVLPASILSSMGIPPGSSIMRSIGDGIFALYAILLSVIGVIYSLQVLKVLRQHSKGANREQQQQFHRVVRITGTTIIVGTVIAVLIVASVAAVVSTDFTPSVNAPLYLAWLVLVHVFCEGGLALTLLYSTYQGAPLFKCRMCTCPTSIACLLPCFCHERDGLHKPLLSHSRSSSSSEDPTYGSNGDLPVPSWAEDYASPSALTGSPKLQLPPSPQLSRHDEEAAYERRQRLRTPSWASEIASGIGRDDVQRCEEDVDGRFGMVGGAMWERWMENRGVITRSDSRLSRSSTAFPSASPSLRSARFPSNAFEMQQQPASSGTLDYRGSLQTTDPLADQWMLASRLNEVITQAGIDRGEGQLEEVKHVHCEQDSFDYSHDVGAAAIAAIEELEAAGELGSLT